MNFVDIFNKSDIITTFTMLLYALVIISYTLVIFKFILLKKRRKILNAFKLLDKCFNENKITDYYDIHYIYNDYTHFQENIPYTTFLEKYIIFLQKSDLEVEQFNFRKDFIKQILEDEKKERPFDGVNEHEKRLLISISDSAKNKELLSVDHELEELSIVLKNNQKRMRNAISMNTWSFPISIISIVVTVIIWQFGKTSISEEDIKSINSNTKISIEKAIKLNKQTKLYNANK